MSLRLRLGLAISLAVAGALIGMSALLWLTERRLLHAGALARAETMARALAQVAEEAVAGDNDLLVIHYVRELPKEDPALRLAYVVVDGRVFAHTDSRLIGGPDPGPGGPEGALPAGDPRDAWTWRQPVRLPNGAGTAVVAYDAERVARRIAEDLRATAIRISEIAFVMLLAGLAVGWKLAETFSRPIAQLEGAAGAIGSGRLETRIPVTRKDELGRLALRFNAMAGQLQELDRMKRDFVAAVTHELKSPLAAIESYLALMLYEARRAGGAHPFEKDLKSIRAQTARLSRFIGDLLDIAKIERAEFALQRAPVALPAVVDEVVHSFAPMAEEAGIRLSTPAPAAAVPVVSADPDRVRQVLFNLVSNALKFTPRGGTVEIRLEPSAAEVACTVTDSGPGIPAELRERLFRRFVQGPNARAAARGPKGTGLGLAISKEIVEAHGGRIGLADERAGSGASFRFTLPCGKGGGAA